MGLVPRLEPTYPIDRICWRRRPDGCGIVDEAKVNDRVAHQATVLRELPRLYEAVERLRQKTFEAVETGPESRTRSDKKLYSPAAGLTQPNH